MHKEGEDMGFRVSRLPYTQIKAFLTVVSIYLLLLAPMGTTENVEASTDGATLNTLKPLRVGFDPNLPPFQYAENHRYTGFNIDILNAIAANEGLTLHYVPMNKEESINSLRQGDIDIILGISFSADLYEDMEFTERYFTSSVGLLVALDNKEIENISDLSEKIVSLQRGTVEYEFLRNIRRIKYNATSNQTAAFEVLMLGRSDAFVGNRQTAEFLLKEEGLSNEYTFVENYVLPLEYSMAVGKQDIALLNVLNTGLQTIKVDGTYSKTYDFWFSSAESNLKKRLQTLIQVFIAVLAVTLILILIGIRWNRQLKKEVDKKTKDLKMVNLSLANQVHKTKNSDQFKEQILDSSPRGVMTCDRQGIITSFNPEAVKIAGLDSKPIGLNFTQVTIIAELLKGKIDNVLQNGTLFLATEQTLARSNGEEFYIRYNVYPLYDFEKEVIGAILSFEDITEEKKLREQLFSQEKSQALSQLVAGVAHEIRNPLTSIKAFVELIPNKLHNPQFQKEIITHVPKEIERLNQLVEGLIDYSKPVSAHKKTIDVMELINTCSILFQRMVQNKGIKLVTELEKGLLVQVDPNQLKQVIINLILNGIEAIEDKINREKSNQETVSETSQISIKAWQENDNVYIQIIDQGIGMTLEEIRRAFDPFYTTKAKGTGLGLALTKQYIQENQGELKLESKVGHGTKITLCFKWRGK
jgi:polar amino acid transport system substrate-binding protein